MFLAKTVYISISNRIFHENYWCLFCLPTQSINFSHRTMRQSSRELKLVDSLFSIRYHWQYVIMFKRYLPRLTRCVCFWLVGVSCDHTFLYFLVSDKSLQPDFPQNIYFSGSNLIWCGGKGICQMSLQPDPENNLANQNNSETLDTNSTGRTWDLELFFKD